MSVMAIFRQLTDSFRAADELEAVCTGFRNPPVQARYIDLSPCHNVNRARTPPSRKLGPPENDVMNLRCGCGAS